jgi:citrate lyase subunit beta/citryl-CoA lyase
VDQTKKDAPGMTVFRSFLFAPGNDARKVGKVFSVGADAVILDLEDAVPLAEKPAAREQVVDALKRDRACPGYVRVNAYDTEFCYRDFAEVVGPWLDGVVLPKVESADQVKSADWLLGNLEREQDLGAGTIDLIPIIETARGLQAAEAVASAGTRARRLVLGGADLTADLNLDSPTDEWTLAHARAMLVQTSRAAGIEPPIDTVWLDVQDLNNLEKAAGRAKQMGFQGKVCIHPSQVDVVNRVFAPTAAEIERAEEIVRAFEKALASGSASIRIDGQFIDYAIVRKAQRTLEIAEAIRRRG